MAMPAEYKILQMNTALLAQGGEGGGDWGGMQQCLHLLLSLHLIVKVLLSMYSHCTALCFFSSAGLQLQDLLVGLHCKHNAV